MTPTRLRAFASYASNKNKKKRKKHTLFDILHQHTSYTIAMKQISITYLNIHPIQ